MDDGSLRHRGVVAAAVSIHDGAAEQFQIGLGQIGDGEVVATALRDGGHYLVCAFLLDDMIGAVVLVVVVAVAAGKELSDIHLMVIDRLAVLYLRGTADAHEGIPRVVDAVLRGLGKNGIVVLILRQFGGRPDGARNIVAAIYVVDDDVVRSVFAVNVHKRPAFHIRHTCTAEDGVDVAVSHGDGGVASHITRITTAIDIAAYGNLRTGWMHREEQEQHTKYSLEQMVIMGRICHIVGLVLSYWYSLSNSV